MFLLVLNDSPSRLRLSQTSECIQSIFCRTDRKLARFNKCHAWLPIVAVYQRKINILTGSAYNSIYKSLCAIRQLLKWLCEATLIRIEGSCSGHTGPVLAALLHDLETGVKFPGVPLTFFCLLPSAALFEMLGVNSFAAPRSAHLPSYQVKLVGPVGTLFQ